LIIGILGCLYFFVFYDFYNITNIEISGNLIVSTDDILDITSNYLAKNKLLIFRNRNIFIFNRNDLKKKIGEVVLLDNIKIEKILPNTVRITLKEKNTAIKWLCNDQEFLVDNQGIIIKKFYKISTPKIFQLAETKTEEVNPTEQSLLIVKNLTQEDMSLGLQVLNPANIEFITNLPNKLSTQDYLKIKNILTPNKLPQYIIVELENGVKIQFNLADELDNQINRLKLLVEQKIKKGNLPNVEYIDLRLGESIYYKMK
jgi:cell division septal protein FtsQ